MRLFLIHIVAFLFCIYYANSTYALIDTASAGNWSSSGIWQSGTSPASGDTLVIPAGVTVIVDCNCGTYANMYILVFGTLDFPAGKKINLSANGKVDVFPGGTVTGDNGGSKLNIGGTTVWDGNDADITGPYSCGSSGCGSNPALPIELIRFNLVQKDNHPIEVEWATASETDNDYFSLFKSSNQQVWEEVSIIAGAGNSIFPMNYTYVDFNNRLADARYIRLDQTDFDGTTKTVGELEVLDQANLDHVILFPNPSTIGIEISLGALSSYQFVQIFDSKGQLIEWFTINEKTTKVSHPINEPGIYQVSLSDEFGNTETMRAVVIK